MDRKLTYYYNFLFRFLCFSLDLLRYVYKTTRQSGLSLPYIIHLKLFSWYSGNLSGVKEWVGSLKFFSFIYLKSKLWRNHNKGGKLLKKASVVEKCLINLDYASTLVNWERGKTRPNPDKLTKLMLNI